MIWDTKGVSFDTVPSILVSPKSFSILNLAKFLLCMEILLKMVLFGTKAHNFAWDEDLKNMDGEALTLEDVCTLCFLVTGFLVAAFFAWFDSLDNFLVAGGGDGRDSEEDMNPLFNGSFKQESKILSTSCRWRFAWDFRILTTESRRIQPIHGSSKG